MSIVFKDVAVSTMTPPGVPVESITPPAKRYHVGTLTYTKAQLFNVFFWMLWGDFCLNLMESVIPRMVPLQLKALGASNATIGLLTGSVFSLMMWVMNPIVSTASDRHRGPRGRRMPFLLYPTPFLAFFLIMVGFSGSIANYLRVSWPGVAGAIAGFFAAVVPEVGTLSGNAQLAIGVMSIMLICYKFFDIFTQTVYYYLFTDIIPQETMGKFACLFRVFCTAGGFAFHYWLLQYADTHPRAIYIGCGLLYMVAFLLLTLIVKEGTYPPPPPRRENLVASLKVWVGESFFIGYYWKYFLSSACFRWAYVPFNTFLIVFAQSRLKMEPRDFGHVMAIVLAVQMPVLLLLGPVIDRFHPVRVAGAGYVALLTAGALGFFFIHDKTTFFVLTMITFVAMAILQGSQACLGPRLLPRQRYGQFCSANAMVSEGGLLILSWGCGKMLDKVGLQFIYLWVATFSLLGIGMVLSLRAAWRRHGGDTSYKAPGGFDTMSIPA